MTSLWRLIAPVCRPFRAKRVRRFMELFQPDRDTRILDVGGLPHFWTIPIDSQITLLNVVPFEDYQFAQMSPNMTAVVGDATRLEFEDQSFDIVFSNSVIEHVGTFERQQAFAREVQRVGKSWWVQTPAHEFPLEPHYFTPFIHWFPKRVQRRLLRNFTLWGLVGRPDEQTVEMSLDELRLLRDGEFRALFPGSELWTERLLGLPKSYTAYKLPARRPDMPRPREARREVPVG